MKKSLINFKGLTVFFTLFIWFTFVKAQAPLLEFRTAIGDLSEVVDIVNAGDGSHRLFVVQQPGTIKVYNQSLQFLGNFLTVTGLNTSGGERGLLSLVFHPDYVTNGYLYVYYTSMPNGDITIARYTRSSTNPNQADTDSRVVLLSIAKPLELSPPFEPDDSHNGGKLNFGPEGYLYFATGDGGSGYDVYEQALNGNSLLGKMIRLDVNNPNPPYYSIPADNPYTNDPNIRDEIWALGLRNPWRWSFDKETHDMWLADVGQRNREEVNFRISGNTGGVNYGWHCYEGSIPTPTLPPCTPPNYVPPVFDYGHNAQGGQAVVGGYVYRGSEYPRLRGYYICGDYVSRNVWLISNAAPNSGNIVVSNPQHILPSALRTFGEAEDGSIFASGVSEIYKVALQAALPVKLISFTLRQGSNLNQLYWETAREDNIKEFVVEYSLDAVSFMAAIKLSPGTNPNGSSYTYRHFIGDERKVYYRLNTVDLDGVHTYSKIISTSSKNQADPLKISSPVSGSASVLMELNVPFRSLKIINVYGQLLRDIIPGNGTGIYYLNTTGWNKGMYTVIAEDGHTQVSRKFIVQ